MFSDTFRDCSSLTGSIPAGLFGNISGQAADGIFGKTFENCSGLTGIVPAGLFGTYTGDPGSYMFAGTFKGCSGLTGVADGIWNLSGINDMPKDWWIAEVFQYASGITSATPTIAKGSTVKLWQKFPLTGGMGQFNGATSFSDYSSIPAGWK